MLGPIARFGSSKGMAKVPNLSGLTRAAAISAIENAGFKFSNSPIVETSNSSLDGKVASQVIAADTLLNYESSLDFSYYVYVAPAVSYTYGPCQIYQAQILSTSGCVSGTCTYITNYLDYYRRIRYANGAYDGEEFCYTQPSSITTSSSSVCCPPPARSCTASTTVAIPWGDCLGGQQTRTMLRISSNCDENYFQEYRCCRVSDSCQDWSDVPWVSASGGSEYKTRTCTDTRCNTYTETKVRCIVRTTTGSCGPCSKKSPFRRTCSTTTTNSDCSQTPGSVSQAC
jgi:hypothetical protein